MNKMTIFIIPHAGGSSAYYSRFKLYHDDYLEFIPIELSGKGKRIGEKEYHSFQELVFDVYTIISRHMQSKECDIAVWGHSMGGIIAYEVMKLLERRYLNRTKLLIVSGCDTPENLNISHSFEVKDVERIRADLIQREWIPEPITSDNKTFDFFINILLNDLRLLSDYKYEDADKQLNVPIVLINGSNDTFVKHKESDWDLYTKGVVYYHIFEGGHFFMDANFNGIVKCIIQHCRARRSPDISLQMAT